MRRFKPTVMFLFLSILCAESFALERFPPPQFDTDYQLPQTVVPDVGVRTLEYVDIAVLAGALVLASVFVHKFRHRAAILILMLLSLLYFGFWRRGCVCPVGSLQNVTFSVFNADYVLPLGVLVFFILPLLFTLLFGRVFCAAVCPLGAVQDAVLIKPLKISGAAESALRLLGWLYLALAVLFAATGSAFIICRYDPFVSFFRFSGNFNLWVVSFCFLAASLFIGRPYCRFFCPYGIILRQFSRLSAKRVTITPDECIKCRLCEDACPFGAINKPTADWPARDYAKSKIRLAFLIVLLPVVTIIGAAVGCVSKNMLSSLHPTVKLAEEVYRDAQAGRTGPELQVLNKTPEQVYSEVDEIRNRFGIGAAFAGAFIGFVGGCKLIGHSIRRRRDDYQADRASCFACGRCFAYCPRERLRRTGPADKTQLKV